MKYLIWIILILLIIVRYFTSRPVYNNADTVRITTTIYSDPIIYPTSQYVKIVGLKVYLPTFPEITYGDKIILEGVVNNGKLEKPKLISVAKNEGPLSGIRNKIISFYNNNLPQPISGLFAGVIFGSKGALTAEFWNATKIAGVAHVIVASGTNVTFVVSFLISLLTTLLPRKKAIPFVILGIVLYLFISGFEAPLIRAAIMSGIVFSAQELGRVVNSWRIFFLTILIMLLICPDWLIDMGFILSFASTMSIMLFQKKIDTWLIKVPNIIKKDLTTTLAAQIGVIPIMFLVFRQFSMWSVLVNVLVLWTIPFIMILGTIGGILGLIFPIIGKIILLIGYPLGWWFTTIVTIFS